MMPGQQDALHGVAHGNTGYACESRGSETHCTAWYMASQGMQDALHGVAHGNTGYACELQGMRACVICT